MKTISSRENPDYKMLLRTAAGRREPGERSGDTLRIALEGVHLCQSWLEQVGQPELAFFDAGRAGTGDIDGAPHAGFSGAAPVAAPQAAPTELDTLLRAVEPTRLRLCTPALLRAASQVAHGQGVIFVGRAPRPTPPPRIATTCLWLDRVQDPGNFGTLLRTAAAAGIGHVYASKGCVAAWSPKVLRSAQGAHFALRIFEDQDLAALRARLDIPLVVTALEDAVTLHDTRLPAAAAWVFGNEGQGVAPALMAQADLRVRIAQSPAVESLNVAVAAGICLFEQRRQISTAGDAPGRSRS